MTTIQLIYITLSILSYVFYVIWFIKPFFGFTITENIINTAYDWEDSVVRICMCLVLGLVTSLLFPIFLLFSPIFLIIYYFAKFAIKKHQNDTTESDL